MERYAEKWEIFWSWNTCSLEPHTVSVKRFWFNEIIGKNVINDFKTDFPFITTFPDRKGCSVSLQLQTIQNLYFEIVDTLLQRNCILGIENDFKLLKFLCIVG